MSRLKLLSLSFLFISIFLACSRQSSEDEAPELIVEMLAVPSPARVGSSVLLIQIRREEQMDPGEFEIDVRGDMSHAGMTPVIVEGVEGDSGAYSTPFEWTMAGDWFVTISATLPDGRQLLRTLPVQVEP